MLKSNFKKGIRVFFYLFDLFKDLFIILINCNSFQYNNTKNYKIIANINLESIYITILLDIFLDIII